ncbi:antitoxin MazE [Gallibacterium salpingitidis]|uniref:Antitoxin MazE n=1 Tax=Gallibacterium salpingitidis TaxID=505341 RepID=A0A1A7QCH6_9PAST|nr:AbrB/MazE/SpoVT family DNA-binding domain-containing protein [Gallibacterium salpingitidis]OBW94687.1 antitoxin MazE [Gallibacterium salpingitidis]OBX08209.1 antitoxin MazE [Gallibacterium salpingitidis]OBX11110.1 antitoxin MazE [Gallibacterium salpingitidis]WKT00122.1 AbrB/MazE/SpoVT family DNA-binding domain-containing protein [Gallibacterium salpingitidis]
MRLEIKQWGNSKAIRLPKDFISQVNLDMGDFLELKQIDGNTITLEIISNKAKNNQTRLTLAERIALTQGELPVLSDWDTMPSVGDEL